MMPWSTLAMVTLVPFGRAVIYSKFRRGRFGAPSLPPGAGSDFAKEKVSIHCPLSYTFVNDKLEDYI
jgi:hypothetical protein